MKSRIELSNLVAVCSDDVVTVQCRFDQFNEHAERYTFKATRSLAETLTKNDLVIGSKSDGTIVTLVVVAIHDKCVFKSMTNFAHSWVFQKVNANALSALNDKEEMLIDQLEDAQRQATQKQMLAALEVDDDTKTLLLETKFDIEEGETIDG